MSRRAGVLWFLGLSVLFLAINHGAYTGFFDNDEIENAHWTRLSDWDTFIRGFLTPLYQPNNFRPTGHLFFRETSIYFGSDFWKYVAALQAIHLFNVWLIWLLGRKLGARPVAAGAACFLFAIHPALYDDVWKPMYVFDVLCATFCLLSILFYAERRWVLSFLGFWLAYKAKELAIMLPVALLLYEWIYGQRKLLRLAPFFAVSLSFGVQGMLRNPNVDNDYTFRFTPAALRTTTVFYAYQVLLVPFAGFLLPVAAWFARSRRAWFGVAVTVCLLAPVLFLPGRLFAAYCYAPFVGLAIAFSGFVEAMGQAPSLLLLCLIFPVDPQALEPRQQALLERDARARDWFFAVGRFARAHPKIAGLLYKGSPVSWGAVGCTSAVQYFYESVDLPVLRDDDPRAAKIGARPVALLDWDADKRVMTVSWVQ